MGIKGLKLGTLGWIDVKQNLLCLGLPVRIFIITSEKAPQLLNSPDQG